MKKANSVEDYIETNRKWSEALTLLRELICSTELVETVKWSIPTYTINGKNVLGIGAFKNHFGIWFFNGVFLKDEHNLLRNAQDGKTKTMRQMNFNSVNEINKTYVLQYVKEAIDNQKLGKEIKPDRKKKTLHVPDELQNCFDNDKALKESFDTLTPYKQREYAEYISSAKREATKTTRLEKITSMIKQGVGLNDKYKNC